MTIANPGPIASVAAGGPVAIDWGNAVRDRTVRHFADTTTRDAEIASPVEGMAVYIDALHALQVYAGPTDLWRAPWNLPWGVMGTASIVTNSAATGAGVNILGLAVTFTAVANRLYKITLSGRDTIQVGAGTTDAGVARASAFIATVLTNQAAGTATLGTIVGFDAPPAGAVTYNARTNCTGTSTQIIASATSQCSLSVEDIGPNGAPA